MPTLPQWREVWKHLSLKTADESLFDKLLACYREPHRRYHTLQHLTECLTNFSEIRAYAEFPAEIEIALWFHDAIYATARKDNEVKSAEWARTSVLAAQLPLAVAERVYSLVMATRHSAIPRSTDAKIIVDVDLWILGAEPARFTQYEQQIRQEYVQIPELLFRHERKKLLQEFLKRPRIFNTDLFLERYEAQARSNLTGSLQQLHA
ncbi:MAG: hypothetical protein U1F42_08325 [Candidatus Competibacteraceae bacterium]